MSLNYTWGDTHESESLAELDETHSENLSGASSSPRSLWQFVWRSSAPAQGSRASSQSSSAATSAYTLPTYTCFDLPEALEDGLSYEELQAGHASIQSQWQQEPRSKFFHSLFEEYDPPSPPTESSDSRVDDKKPKDEGFRLFNWLRKGKQREMQDDVRQEKSSDSDSSDEESPPPEQQPKGKTRLSKEQTSLSIFEPHGKWAWSMGEPLVDAEFQSSLGSGLMTKTTLMKATLVGRPITYVSKCWDPRTIGPGFYTELGIYKSQGYLKSLQGEVIPHIIGAFSVCNGVGVAMEPPHSAFWIEASQFMPHVLKERCVEAFERIHAHGVLHGDPELRNMLIGGDGKVTIIDFHTSRAVAPNAAVYIDKAEPDEFKMEMRRVKFKLDYEDARKKECDKVVRLQQRLTRNAERRQKRVRQAQGEAIEEISDLEEALPEDLLEPSPSEAVFRNVWMNRARDKMPRRTIVHGLTKEEWQTECKNFLTILVVMEARRLASLPTGDNANSPIHSAKNDPPSQPHRYNLRKRKHSDVESATTDIDGSSSRAKRGRSSSNNGASGSETGNRTASSNNGMSASTPSGASGFEPAASAVASGFEIGGIKERASPQRNSSLDSHHQLPTTSSTAENQAPPTNTLDFGFLYNIKAIGRQVQAMERASNPSPTIATPPTASNAPVDSPPEILLSPEELVKSTIDTGSDSSGKQYPPIKVHDFAYEPYNGPRGFYVPHPPTEKIMETYRYVDIRQNNIRLCKQEDLPHSVLQAPNIERGTSHNKVVVSVGGLRRAAQAVKLMTHPELSRFQERKRARTYIRDTEILDTSVKRKRSESGTRRVKFGRFTKHTYIVPTENETAEEPEVDPNPSPRKSARIAQAEASSRSSRPRRSRRSSQVQPLQGILRPTPSVRTVSYEKHNWDHIDMEVERLSPVLGPRSDWVETKDFRLQTLGGAKSFPDWLFKEEGERLANGAELTFSWKKHGDGVRPSVRPAPLTAQPSAMYIPPKGPALVAFEEEMKLIRDELIAERAARARVNQRLSETCQESWGLGVELPADPDDDNWRTPRSISVENYPKDLAKQLRKRRKQREEWEALEREPIDERTRYIRLQAERLRTQYNAGQLANASIPPSSFMEPLQPQAGPSRTQNDRAQGLNTSILPSSFAEQLQPQSGPSRTQNDRASSPRAASSPYSTSMRRNFTRPDPVLPMDPAVDNLPPPTNTEQVKVGRGGKRRKQQSRKLKLKRKGQSPAPSREASPTSSEHEVEAMMQCKEEEEEEAAQITWASPTPERVHRAWWMLY